MSNIDLTYLTRALELAKIRRGFCAPNPSVGAVIVKNNRMLSLGYHLGPGQDHAEIHALNKLTPEEMQGATVYVTLEPCCHQGRTPPCTDALIKAGVRRVVYGFCDTNPIVAGRGDAILKAAGIISEHLPLTEITDFYQSYVHWHRTQKPFLTAKIALTLDGKIADESSHPIEITGPELGEFTHHRRKWSDALLTTSKTILQDNPQLNVRLQNESIAKPLYVLDSQLQVPDKAHIFKTAKCLTFFHENNAPKKNLQRLVRKGARCIAIESEESGLVLEQVLEHIGRDGMHDVWIEAGGQCFSAFLQKKLLQRAYIYIAPRWLGEGKSAFPSSFGYDFSTHKVRFEPVGDDVLCEINF